eukprot:scaffold15.g4254.t1
MSAPLACRAQLAGPNSSQHAKKSSGPSVAALKAAPLRGAGGLAGLVWTAPALALDGASIPADGSLNFSEGFQGANYESLAAASQSLAAKADLPAIDLPSLPAVELPAGLATFLADNGLVVVGAVALAVGLQFAVSALAGGAGGKAKALPAAQALEALASSPSAVLLDIRSKADAKASGSPDLKSLKKAVVAVPLFAPVAKGAEVDPAFGARVAKLRGINADTTLILLDRQADSKPAGAPPAPPVPWLAWPTDGTAYGVAAKAIAEALPEVRSLLAVAGGAEGWQAAGAPWRAPGAALSLSLPSVDLRSIGKGLDNLAEDFKDAPSLGKGLLGVAAIGGASFLLVNQVGAGVPLSTTIVNEKVAIQDAGKDIQKIAATLVSEAVELQEGEEGAAAAKRAIEGVPTAPAAAAAAAPVAVVESA